MFDPAKTALLIKAAADPIRLTILRLLKHHSFGVLELVDILDAKQSSISHHLKKLSEADLVSTRREGNFIFYRRAPSKQLDRWDTYRHSLFELIDEEALTEDLDERVNQVLKLRAESGLAFFAEHAGQFSEVADLIAGYDQYKETLESLLETLPSSNNESSSARIGMEVGPAEGGFLSALSTLCEEVYALDISPEMLQLAKQWSQDRKLNNIEFILGSPKDALASNLNADIIAFNMVLHHIPSPAEVINDSAKLLNDDGWLLITELCPHDQDWVRESCGDFWLGIDPADLDAWAFDAGLILHNRILLALKNGFQVQAVLFHKSKRQN